MQVHPQCMASALQCWEMYDAAHCSSIIICSLICRERWFDSLHCKLLVSTPCSVRCVRLCPLVSRLRRMQVEMLRLQALTAEPPEMHLAVQQAVSSPAATNESGLHR